MLRIEGKVLSAGVATQLTGRTTTVYMRPALPRERERESTKTAKQQGTSTRRARPVSDRRRSIRQYRERPDTRKRTLSRSSRPSQKKRQSQTSTSHCQPHRPRLINQSQRALLQEEGREAIPFFFKVSTSLGGRNKESKRVSSAWESMKLNIRA